MIIPQATPSDVPELATITSEVVAWLNTKGTDQWQKLAPGGASERRVTSVWADAVEHGTAWIARNAAGVALGGMIVDTVADPELWFAEDAPDTALYMHRMVASRSAPEADGVGKHLIAHAVNQADAAAKLWLRLDAWATNTALHQYYVAAGFEHVRTCHYDHRGSGACFQHPTGRHHGCPH